MAGSGYIGKAGQLAVMAEFLLRGYNVSDGQLLWSARVDAISEGTLHQCAHKRETRAETGP